MSWYSNIYVYVRNYRAKNPISGFFLSKMLNILIVMQFLLAIYSSMVYTHIVCGHFLQSAIQASIWLSVYYSLLGMATWCLITTITTPTSFVPPFYAVTEEQDKKLKEVTPCVNGRYMVEKSTAVQSKQQGDLMAEMMQSKNIMLAECDAAGRNKYCYQCATIKPDRSHHCSSCGRCVVKFDHHCPWINQCVNYSNYKSFVLYIIYSTATVVWFEVTSLECIVRYFINGKFGEEAWMLVCLILVMIPFAVFGYYPLGQMLLYHKGLISLNETTCEQAKPAVLKFDFQADYNMGRRENFKQVFGWGLWLVPLPTATEDGMHFKIRYADPTLATKYERIRVDARSEK